ncbi:hypothetical protein GCM10027443_23370 [Pontibacter brevis]
MKELYSTILTNDYFEIGQHDGLQAIILTYKRKGTSAEFRSLHYKLVEAFEKKRKGKLLVDARKLGIVAPEDQRWVGHHIVPQMARHNDRKFLSVAVVTTSYVFTQMAINNIEQLSVDTGSCINKHFHDMTEATNWLAEQ